MTYVSRKLEWKAEQGLKPRHSDRERIESQVVVLYPDFEFPRNHQESEINTSVQ